MLKTKKLKRIEIKSSRYSPKCYKRKMKWEKNLFLGLELELENESIEDEDFDCDCEFGECECDYKDETDKLNEDLVNVDRILKKHSKTTNPFYYKDDGSLDNGVEFVTKPMSLQYMHNNINIKEVLDFINTKTKFCSKESCGIHVHLSKDFFTPLELVKLRIFFSVNEKPLSIFSGRSEDSIDQWARFEKGYRIKDFLNGNRRRMVTREYACSFLTNTNGKTVEIRLFASTTNHKKLISILQFADAVSYFLKENSIITIQKKSCWKTFIDWCDQKNRYGHLMEELENVNLAS